MPSDRPSSEPIAIIGSSCRFAGGATSPSKLWEVLRDAPDLSREVPEDRFSAKGFYHADGEYHGTTNAVRGYWLDQDHRVFDASFFNIIPKEAEAIDPQQRLLLEVVYEALESAGFTLSQFSGKDVAVFAGVMTADYDTLSQRDELLTSQYYATGNARSIISNRISYFFDFHGPSMTIDTACSSSLVALHQAVLSLRSGESVMACVTGVNLMITPEQFIVESNLHMLSPTGKCRMWDAGADGYARGEGVAALFIKPLSRALADGDEIQAIIRETGVNSDGRTKGITMPNPEAQATLIKNTYQRAGLDPRNPNDRCQYFEAHGTGTHAGDPREAAAISEAFFGASKDESETYPAISQGGKLLVGSLKTVIGHTEGAAGLAGLLKVMQSMKHGSVPPNLHLESLNPSVTPFYTHLQVPTSLLSWPEPPAGQPLRASVNSFGFGGTNSHVIVESYLPAVHDEISQSYQSSPALETGVRRLSLQQTREVADQKSFSLPLFISAASQKSLRQIVGSYRDYLVRHPNVCVSELAWQLYSRRTALQYRLAVSTTSKSQALQSLSSILDKSAPSGEIGVRSKNMTGPLQILGIFTGQGAQWPTMSRSLFRTNKTYRETIRTLDEVIKTCPHPAEWSLEEQILAEKDVSRIHEAAVSQPLCTALQIALVDLMRSLQIDFHTVIGHSSGEIAAAYTAGRLSARDSMLISYYRGKFAYLAGGPDGEKGGMLAAGLSESEALGFCRDPMFEGRICVAASNASSSVTLSGDLNMIQSAQEELTKQKKFVRPLLVDTAYHSPHMVKSANEYVRALQECGISSVAEGNGITWVSSVYGYSRTGEKDLDAGYWKDNMVYTVQFHDAVENALAEYGPFDCAVEIGPHAALKGPVTQTAKNQGIDLPYSGALDRSKDDSLAFSDFLGFIWSNYGPLEVDLCHYVEQSPKFDVIQSRLSDLPSYPWDHSQTHYRESRLSRQYHLKTAPPHELLGVRTRDDNEHELRWRNILKLEKIPWLEHHSFQGQALLPASGYCVMALDAALCFLDGRSASLVELQDLNIMSGVSIDRDSSGTEVLFSLTILTPQKDNKSGSIIDAAFSLASCPADGTTTMKKNVDGKLKIVLGEAATGALPTREPCQSETFPATPEAFYKMMDETGLVYSGPFRSLTSIQRRHDYCSATLKRLHPEDTTTLQVSPATLDSCFQSAFLSYASPGDKSLWTSFLPVRIERVCFSIGTQNKASVAPKDGLLTVDTHMTDAKSATPASKSTFVVDINIFNDEGAGAVQIRGLAVSSLANTQPKDDYELYLHTLMDVDPTDEIMQASLEERVADDPVLAKDCTRVASFFLGHDCLTQLSRAFSNGGHEDLPDVETLHSLWASDAEEDIDRMIFDSDYRSCLEYMRSLALYASNFRSRSLPIAAGEVQYLNRFESHVCSIVKQVVHRHPRMSVLSLTDSQAGLAQRVVAVTDSFLTFTVGTAAKQDPDTKLRNSITSGDHVRVITVDTAKDLKPQLGLETFQDLVLLSTSCLDNGNATDILKNVRATMRPGAYLVLVQTPPVPVDGGGGAFAPLADPPTPPEWPDILDKCDFIQLAKNSDQHYRHGYSIMVRQLRSPMLEFIRSPLKLAQGNVTDSLLLIGASDQASGPLATSLQQQLSPFCAEIVSRASFDVVSTQDLDNCTAAIVLADLDGPVLAEITAHRLGQLRGLLRPNMTVLWLTFDARSGNPEHAATFGFTRTIAAEIPNLTLQVLDLEHVELSEHIVAETFLRMIVTKKEEHDTMWSHEPEIHIWNGRRLVPRVMPLQESNDRINAMRRVVPRPTKTFLDSVEVVPYRTPDGLVGHEIRDNGPVARNILPGLVLVQVQYSSAEAVRLPDGCSAYVCLGRIESTRVHAIALSEENSNYVSVPQSCVFELAENMRVEVTLIHFLVRYLVARTSRTLAGAGDTQLVLINPDVEFMECLKEVMDSSDDQMTAYTTTVGNSNPGLSFLHPKSSTREIREIVQARGTTIIDFSSEDEELSQRIQDLLPRNCMYHSRASIFQPEADFGEDEHSEVVSLSFAEAKARSNPRVDSFRAISLPEFQAKLGSPAPFQILDWAFERNIQRTTNPTNPIIEGQLFREDGTYVLVGLTRDFGQSLSRLFVSHGARNIVLASRNPKTSSKWTEELARSHGATIKVERLDVTDLDSVRSFKSRISETLPPVAGVINGAMVLDDRVFAQMTAETWNRVLRPKTVGSKNLDIVFSSPGCDLDFFIMTSSFAAIGGHPGQSNYAAANMYMNGLAANRRRRGLAGSVLNIGVIYGLGFLQREKAQLYAGLEREGYPPVSERDVHHMFLEAIVAGQPGMVGQPVDLTTGLSRFRPGAENPLHWHLDPRFGHFTIKDKEGSADGVVGVRESLKKTMEALNDRDGIADAIFVAFEERLEGLLQLPKGGVNKHHSLAELGIDSLIAVEIRNWIWKTVGKDVAVLKLLGDNSIFKLCLELSDQTLAERAQVEETSSAATDDSVPGQVPA